MPMTTATPIKKPTTWQMRYNSIYYNCFTTAKWYHQTTTNNNIALTTTNNNITMTSSWQWELLQPRPRHCKKIHQQMHGISFYYRSCTMSTSNNNNNTTMTTCDSSSNNNNHHHSSPSDRWDWKRKKTKFFEAVVKKTATAKKLFDGSRL